MASPVSSHPGLVNYLARFDFAGGVGFGLFEFALLGSNDRYQR